MQTIDVTSVASEYPVLRCYLGELQFSSLIRKACSKPASQGKTWKQLSDLLPACLAGLPLAAAEIPELACLERAMRKAFEASEPSSFSPGQLHPSVTVLRFHQNTASLWSALICGEPPPRPYHLDLAQHLIVWRHKGQSRMRLLGEEEYLCIANFSPLPDENSAAIQAATAFYVAGWLASEVVLAATSCPAEK